MNDIILEQDFFDMSKKDELIWSLVRIGRLFQEMTSLIRFFAVEIDWVWDCD